MATIVKVFPTVEECKKNNYVKCTEKSCSSIFTSEANLTLHLVKTHNKTHLWQNDICKQFHCPQMDCSYNKAKFFKNIKSLRQHFLKVHTLKQFNCTSCTKTFPSEELCKNHSNYCGVSFKCCNCDVQYACYETLKTHARRKKHTIMNKNEYKSTNNLIKVPNTTSNLIVNCFGGRLILPKPLPSSNIINQSIQTENILLITQNTQQTQTGAKNELQNVETQTILEDSNVKLPINNVDDNRKSIKTQTNEKLFKSQSCNTSFNLEDFDFIMTNEVEKNTSSTQTNHINLNIYSTPNTDSIHTDASDLLTSALNDNLNSFDDSTFFNCNMETQTDLMLQDDLFNCYCSNDMYTQTCDDVLSGLGFSDIETQTAIDDMLNSVEIQTTMSHSKRVCLNSQVFANIETQTDTEFQQMLEEINS